MKKHLLFIIILLFVFKTGHGQNLVPNPSFEDTVHCPGTPSELYDTQYWINPTAASPDYFNACCTIVGAVGVPSNGFGSQTAYNGVAYAGFYAYNTVEKNYKEYIQIALSDSLIANNKYYISFYVSLGDYSQYAVATLGAYLSKTTISSSNETTLTYTPQVQYQNNVPISDKTNWTLVSDTIVAQGGEKYITIGNFKSDSLSDTLYLGFSTSANVAYYYIDAVSVIDVATMGMQTINRQLTFKISPNPSSGSISIAGKVNIDELKVSDMLGQIVYEAKPNTINTTLTLTDVGVYFITLTSGTETSTKKVIVSK